MYTLTELRKLIASYSEEVAEPVGPSYADKMEHRIAELKLQLYLTEYRQVTGKEYVPTGGPN